MRIVLVEPAGGLNVGAIARVMKNMGLSQLVVVNPQCNVLGTAARRMSVHAADVLESAQVVDTLPSALSGCQRAIATTARSRSQAIVLEPPDSALPWLLESDAIGAIIFGPEDRGLSNEELNYAQRFVSIPSSPVYPVLNLAQSVTICCYELYQAQFHTQSPTQSPTQFPTQAPIPEADLAPIEALEAYYQHLETLLMQIGYLHPHTAASRMQKLRYLLNRSLPSSPELALLRGILSQVEWAIQHLPRSQE